MLPDEPIVHAILAALAAVRLEAIWRPVAPPRIELLVRDTPRHRARAAELAAHLGCARVPLSDQARTIALVGAARPIDLVFGRAAGASYGRLRAAAIRVTLGAHVALVSPPAA